MFNYTQPYTESKSDKTSYRKGEEKMTTIITSVICFFGGAVVGFIISALLIAGRDDND